MKAALIEVPTEKDIQAAVLDWLNTVPNCKAWRQNVGGLEYLKANGRKGLVKFGQPGMSDLTGIVNGIRLEIEIKRPGKGPTIEQSAWMHFIQDKGGISFWCDSLRSCIEQLRYEFEKRAWLWLKRWEVS